MISYRHLDGAEARKHGSELREVYAAVFSEPPYNESPEMADRFVSWLRDESREPGFDLVEARDGERLVGFAYGNAVDANWWWGHADTPAELGRDKFVVQEWAVLPNDRGSGV